MEDAKAHVAKGANGFEVIVHVPYDRGLTEDDYRTITVTLLHKLEQEKRSIESGRAAYPHLTRDFAVQVWKVLKKINPEVAGAHAETLGRPREW